MRFLTLILMATVALLALVTPADAGIFRQHTRIRIIQKTPKSCPPAALPKVVVPTLPAPATTPAVKLRQCGPGGCSVRQ